MSIEDVDHIEACIKTYRQSTDLALRDIPHQVVLDIWIDRLVNADISIDALEAAIQNHRAKQ